MGMIVVDSGIWIDLINNRITLQTHALRGFIIEDRDIAVGDLVLMEVLQGARSEQHFRSAHDLLQQFDRLAISDYHVAIEAARNYRLLRAKGITIRKTIDTLIATRCILDGLPLLYSDRDFDPFVEHLGLVSALDLPGVN